MRIPLARIAAVTMPLLASGCVDRMYLKSNPEPGEPYRFTELGCERLRNANRAWGAFGIGATALAGGTGISTVTVESTSAKNALAITAAILAALGAASAYISSDLGEERKAHKECY